MQSRVLAQLEEFARVKQALLLQELRAVAPDVPDATLLQLYSTSISLRQSKVQRHGESLENEIVAPILRGLPYHQQVVIDSEGKIAGSKQNCYHIVDFVIGEGVEPGKSITDFIVLSCKTTCRDRWTQDAWTLTYSPKLYILVTVSDDYPPAERFREDEKRKIVSCFCKRKDDRKYPYTFDDLLPAIQAALTEK
jgi:hypothetical protein